MLLAVLYYFLVKLVVGLGVGVHPLHHDHQHLALCVEVLLARAAVLPPTVQEIMLRLGHCHHAPLAEGALHLAWVLAPGVEAADTRMLPSLCVNLGFLLDCKAFSCWWLFVPFQLLFSCFLFRSKDDFQKCINTLQERCNMQQ